jgi:hypothetical protein
MKKCLKCQFVSQETDRRDCPKCGAIYSKVEKLNHDYVQQQRTVRQLSDKLEFLLDSDPDEYPLSGLADEQWFERDQYPIVSYLSLFFLLLAAIVAIGEIAGISYFYRFMSELGVYGTEQLVTQTILLSLGSIVPVALIVAISYLLAMHRDMANDARSTREFLRIIAAKLK